MCGLVHSHSLTPVSQKTVLAQTVDYADEVLRRECRADERAHAVGILLADVANDTALSPSPALVLPRVGRDQRPDHHLVLHCIIGRA